jgi:hypothetical protein
MVPLLGSDGLAAGVGGSCLASSQRNAKLRDKNFSKRRRRIKAGVWQRSLRRIRR